MKLYSTAKIKSYELHTVYKKIFMLIEIMNIENQWGLILSECTQFYIV
jgi:hypothetical protein